MVPEYVEKIKNWPIPTTGKELVSFPGFTSYYRGFIPRYAETVAALIKYRNAKNIVLKTEDTRIKETVLDAANTCLPGLQLRGTLYFGYRFFWDSRWMDTGPSPRRTGEIYCLFFQISGHSTTEIPCT